MKTRQKMLYLAVKSCDVLLNAAFCRGMRCCAVFWGKVEHGRYNIEGDRDKGNGRGRGRHEQRERERARETYTYTFISFGACGCACVSISLALALYTHNHTWMNSWAFESHSVPIFFISIVPLFPRWPYSLCVYGSPRAITTEVYA